MIIFGRFLAVEILFRGRSKISMKGFVRNLGIGIGFSMGGFLFRKEMFMLQSLRLSMLRLRRATAMNGNMIRAVSD
jgi:hypothetical protein